MKDLSEETQWMPLSLIFTKVRSVQSGRRINSFSDKASLNISNDNIKFISFSITSTENSSDCNVSIDFYVAVGTSVDVVLDCLDQILEKFKIPSNLSRNLPDELFLPSNINDLLDGAQLAVRKDGKTSLCFGGCYINPL